MSLKVIEQALVLANNYRRITDQILRERLGVTYTKFLILDQINLGGVTSNIISKNLGKTEASISRQITIIEKELLIKRKRGASDDRLKKIFLTQKGVLMLKNCHKVIDTYFLTKTSEIDSKENIVKVLKSVNQDIAKL